MFLVFSMAEYPDRGISEEELVEEFRAVASKYELIVQKMNVYSDLGPRGKRPGEMDVQNLFQYLELRIQLFECQNRFMVLYGLHEKYFPHSSIFEVENKTLEDIALGMERFREEFFLPVKALREISKRQPK